MEWLYLKHKDSDAVQSFPDEPGVLDFYTSRGWVETGPPKDPAFDPRPNDKAEGDPEWVTMHHTKASATHDFPNNPEAIAGAEELGWKLPAKPKPETKPDESPPKAKASAKAHTEKENG